MWGNLGFSQPDTILQPRSRFQSMVQHAWSPNPRNDSTRSGSSDSGRWNANAVMSRGVVESGMAFAFQHPLGCGNQLLVIHEESAPLAIVAPVVAEAFFGHRGDIGLGVSRTPQVQLANSTSKSSPVCVGGYCTGATAITRAHPRSCTSPSHVQPANHTISAP
jgi:hypothetical protein